MPTKNMSFSSSLQVFDVERVADRKHFALKDVDLSRQDSPTFLNYWNEIRNMELLQGSPYIIELFS